MFLSYAVTFSVSVIGTSFGKFLVKPGLFLTSEKYLETSDLVFSISISPATTKTALSGL